MQLRAPELAAIRHFEADRSHYEWLWGRGKPINEFKVTRLGRFRNLFRHPSSVRIKIEADQKEVEISLFREGESNWSFVSSLTYCYR